MNEKMINKELLIDYLNLIKKHYENLSKLMKLENKIRYYNECVGKINFIDLLLLEIKNEMFIGI